MPDPIPFKHTDDGFLLGYEPLPSWVGLRHIYVLVLNRHRLISCNVLCDGVESLADPVMDHDYVIALRNHIAELSECACTTRQIDELDFLQKFLRENTFIGKPARFSDDAEKSRDRVRRSVAKVFKELQVRPALEEIGQHFEGNIILGHRCVYTGDRKFIF